MKKFFLPIVLLCTAAGFSSCSDDDDDDPNISVSINGVGIENNGSTTLPKGTVSPTLTTGDTVSISFSNMDEKNITSIQMTAKNDFEKDVPVYALNGIVLNSKSTLSAAQTQDLKFIGVYAEYTVKIKSENGSNTFKFKLDPASDAVAGQKDYSSPNSQLCNPHTVKLDASKTGVFDQKYNDLTYTQKEVGGVKKSNFGSAKFYAISQEDYNNYQDKLRNDYNEAVNKFKFVTIDNINLTDYKYVVCHVSNKKNYLIHITEKEGSTITMQVQY